MDFAQLQRLLQQRGGGGANANADTPMQDTAEKIQISSLSLLKMLKHGMNSNAILVSKVRVYFWFA
jgi:hypothetical protein